MYDEAKCTWPECACTVPYYAFSGHNRVDYCDKLAVVEKNDRDIERELDEWIDSLPDGKDSEIPETPETT